LSNLFNLNILNISILLCLMSFVSCSQVEQGNNEVSGSAEATSVALTPTQERVQEILKNNQSNTSYTPYQQQKRTHNSPIPKEIEQRLIEQGEEMFIYLQAYDLEALDVYAPTIEEMGEYYKIFNPNAFQIKWNFFQKNYDTDGLSFGDNLEYDQDLIKRIAARGAVLRTKSLCLTKERVRIDDGVEVNKIYTKPSKRHNDMYDIHIRFKKKDEELYYEVVNEACWLTDRTCIYTQSWKFLGRYIHYTDKYIDSELNRRDVDAGDIDSPLFKKKPEDRVTF